MYQKLVNVSINSVTIKPKFNLVFLFVRFAESKRPRVSFLAIGILV